MPAIAIQGASSAGALGDVGSPVLAVTAYLVVALAGMALVAARTEAA